MATFGRNWLDDEDDYDDSLIFRHWKEDFSENKTIEYIEKPKVKLSNQEIINIINKRSKKDKEFIINNLKQ